MRNMTWRNVKANVPAFFLLKTKTIDKIRIMSEKRYIINVLLYCNLIWRIVSRLVDEVIPFNHPRRFASRVIRGYDLINST